MTLAPEDRKKKLGHGGLSKISRITRRTAGHVTEVNFERRRDVVVERAITRRVVRLHPDINPGDVWPAHYSQESSQRGGDDRTDVNHDRMVATQGTNDVPTNSGATGIAPKTVRTT